MVRQVKMLPGNVLSISGERTIEQKGGDEDRAASYERRFFGSFQRSFRLPDNVDMENISAKVWPCTFVLPYLFFELHASFKSIRLRAPSPHLLVNAFSLHGTHTF